MEWEFASFSLTRATYNKWLSNIPQFLFLSALICKVVQMKLTSHLHQSLTGRLHLNYLFDRSHLDRHSFAVRFKFAASSLVSASGTGVNSFSGSATEVSSTLSLKKESTLSLKTILECSRLVHQNSRLKSNTDQAQ